MSKVAAQLLIALVSTTVIGVVSGGEWPHFLVGAVLALALWVSVFAGSYASPRRGEVSTTVYLAASVFALVLGYVMREVLDANTGWAIGMVMAAAIGPGVAAAESSRASD